MSRDLMKCCRTYIVKTYHILWSEDLSTVASTHDHRTRLWSQELSCDKRKHLDHGWGNVLWSQNMANENTPRNERVARHWLSPMCVMDSLCIHIYIYIYIYIYTCLYICTCIHIIICIYIYTYIYIYVIWLCMVSLSVSFSLSFYITYAHIHTH